MRNTKTKSTSVIGLQYGDEGKGQIVDLLSGKHDIVVRYNGGANAGHSVEIGNEKYVLHQIPIGVLTPGRINVLGNGVVISLEALIDEITMLEKSGIALGGLLISNRAHIVMPYHLQEEQLRHQLTTDLLGDEKPLGTTFKGIGLCYADKAYRDTAIRIEDLYHPKALAERLKYIVALKNSTLSGLANEVGVDFQPYTVDELLKQLCYWADILEPFICDTATMLNEEGVTLLFEGANSAMLDIDHGTFPYVTSSHGSTFGITAGTGHFPKNLDKIGVAKVYMTRVGTGPFVTEIFGDLADLIRETGSEYGSTTGRPRRIGWLDLPALRSMVMLNNIDKLVLTGLSVMSTLDKFQVCTGYRLDGKIITDIPASIEDIERVKPVFEEFDIYSDDSPVHSSECMDDLPNWALSLVGLIEGEVGRVAGVCIGRRRDQVLWY